MLSPSHHAHFSELLNKLIENDTKSDERLLIIGQSTIDDIYREGEGLVFETAPGGDAIYSALGASVWPVPIGVVSIIGRDYPHDKLETTTCHPELTDWSGLHYYDGPTIHDKAYYFKDGSRKYIFDDETLLHQLSPKPVDIPELLSESKFVHISAANANAQLEVLKYFKARGASVSLDLESHFITGYEDVVNEMLLLDPIFMPSIEHISLISGKEQNDPHDLWRWINDKGLSLSLIKNGNKGAWLFQRTKRKCWQVGIVPGLTVADSTGAGDAFCGGFMAGYMKTGDPIIAAACGAVSASFIVETWAALRPEHYSLDLAVTRLTGILAKVTEEAMILP